MQLSVVRCPALILQERDMYCVQLPIGSFRLRDASVVHGARLVRARMIQTADQYEIATAKRKAQNSKRRRSVPDLDW